MSCPRLARCLLAAPLLLLILLLALPSAAFAHGEIAQMAGIRMRTIHWFDTQIEPRQVAVNEVVTVRGRFKVSEHWPDYVAKPEEWVFLNIGVPGPTFIRLDTTINGMRQLQSTALRRGEFYDYEVKLKARVPGIWHVHPLVNVWEAGPVIGPAHFVEITGDAENFVNEAVLLNGERIDVERYGLRTMSSVHLVWLLVGLLWIGYWFRRLPVMMRRYVAVQELGEAEAERRLISWQDIIVSALFLALVLGLTAGIALWANGRYPITMPLQTGRVEAPVLPLPGAQAPIEIEIHEARFNLPRRTLTLDLTVANGTEAPLAVGQFVAGYVRFTNGEVIEARREDEYDMVAPDSLSVSRQSLAPGASTRLTLQIEDAIWEEQRLVDIVAEPDLRIAGLLFFYDTAGNRYVREIGTRITPEFSITPDAAEQLDNLQLVRSPLPGTRPDA